jgi:HAD superfamily hydrolase (TIGR01484 family)
MRSVQMPDVRWWVGRNNLICLVGSVMRGPAVLIVDLDGTLIGGEEGVSTGVSDALNKLPRGFLVSIASGRPPGEVMVFAHQLGLTSPQICDGGATILDPLSQQTLWRSNPLPLERAQKILVTLDLLKATFIATYPDGSITHMAQGTNWNFSRISALDLSEHLANELLARFTRPDLEVVKMFLPTTGLWGVNFAPNGVNKGVAAVKVAQLLGIKPSQLVAAGDSYNDIPLLEICGLSIAMGNAPEELKAIADYIAPSVVEDGLAVAIEEFLLPKL